ncbi:MAG: hypothetical protein ABIQ99_16590 [Thermoflexales bacterium]
MPFYRFSIDTPLTQDEAMARLRTLIHERKRSGILEAFEDEMLRSKNDVTPFVGQIEGYTFRVQRDRWKPFSGYPRIRGDVLPAQSGSRVRITVLPDPLLVFSVLPLAGAIVFGTFRGFAEGYANGAPPSLGVLLAFAAGACMWAAGISLDARELRDTIVAALSAKV